MQRTFSMIKPDAVQKGATGAILAAIEAAGFRIVALKKTYIAKAQAETFYQVHAGRYYFAALCEFMSSGPIYLMALEKDNAIADLRTLMGATDPARAAEGTLRRQFGNPAVIRENAIHGSDSEESATAELAYWFAGSELV